LINQGLNIGPNMRNLIQ